MSVEGRRRRIGCTQSGGQRSSEAWDVGPLRKPSMDPQEYLAEAKSQQGCCLIFLSHLLQVPRFAHHLLPVSSVPVKAIKHFKYERMQLFFFGGEVQRMRKLILTLAAPIAPAHHQLIFFTSFRRRQLQ